MVQRERSKWGLPATELSRRANKTPVCEHDQHHDYYQQCFAKIRALSTRGECWPPNITASRGGWEGCTRAALQELKEMLAVFESDRRAPMPVFKPRQSELIVATRAAIATVSGT